MPKFDIDKTITKTTNRVMFNDIDPNVYSVYAIGDIHGCFVEMQELVDKCTNHAKDSDRIPVVIFLGDMIDRGPDFLDIFKFIEEHDITCILGNHELHFYLEAMQVKECRSKARRDNHRRFESYDQDTQNKILERIGNMSNGVIIHFTKDAQTPFRDFILTHSPIRGIEHATSGGDDFDFVHLMNGPQCNMRSEVVDFKQLQESFDGVMMVHGHQSWNFKPIAEQDEEQKFSTNRVFNVDSGVVYGDVLTALCLNTNEFIEVQAKQAYSERH